jgi:hypothetical protein
MGNTSPSTVKIIELYSPTSGELYDFDMRRRVLSIIWGAI